MRRLYFLPALLLVLVVGACVPLKGTPPGDLCRSTVASLLHEWSGTGRVVATQVDCVPATPGSNHGGGWNYLTGTAHVTYGNNPETTAWYRYAIAHELGHAYHDVHLLSRTWRVKYAEVMGLARWDGEHYADTFAFVLGGWYPSNYGTPPPTSQQTSLLCIERLVPC
jgi:hypothetical protein